MLTCLRGPQGRLVLPIGSPSQNKEFTYLLTYLLTKVLGFFVYAKNAINVIWRLTLRHMLAESFELKLLCKNVAFIVEYKYT